MSGSLCRRGACAVRLSACGEWLVGAHCPGRRCRPSGAAAAQGVRAVVGACSVARCAAAAQDVGAAPLPRIPAGPVPVPPVVDPGAVHRPGHHMADARRDLLIAAGAAVVAPGGAGDRTHHPVLAPVGLGALQQRTPGGGSRLVGPVVGPSGAVAAGRHGESLSGGGGQQGTGGHEPAAPLRSRVGRPGGSLARFAPDRQ